MWNKPVLIAGLSLIILTLTACAKPQPEKVVEPEIPVIEPEGPIGPNPVEVYCTGLGYEFTAREHKIEDQQTQSEVLSESTNETPEVPQPGIPVVPDYIIEVVCAFPDGNKCEEEEFRSGRCGQEYSYCVQQGYTLEQGVNSATCVFPDGSSCPELVFFNGDCGPVTSQYTEVPMTDHSIMGAIEIQCAEFYEEQHLTVDLEIVVGDEFTITLCSNPTTGFQWIEHADINNQDIVGQIDHGFIAPPDEDQPPPPGTTGDVMWTFRALQEGNSTISFEYSQDWDGGEKATWTLVLSVLVK